MSLEQFINSTKDVGSNVSFSVFKREARPYKEVETHLLKEGWKKTGSIGSRVHYFENSGFSFTVVKGANATLIFPSGPIRGRIFSRSAGGLSSMSGIGMGSRGSKKSQSKTQNRSSNADSQVLV